MKLVTILLLLLHAGAALANASVAGEEVVAYESKKFALGVGLGIVKFDTNAKVTSKETGRSYYVDLEGNLNLPDSDKVNTIYGAYRFNEKHSLVFGYFAIERDSSILDLSADFNDIIVVKADVSIEDNTRFYNLGYGYNLFADDRSDVTLVFGLKSLDLRLKVEASGEIIVNGETRSGVEIVEADVLAPLPLIGLNFGFNFTPKWSISARVGLVGGSYQDVSANVIETSINSRYQFSRNTGLLLGLIHFDANVDIDDDDKITEVSYSYNGAFVGLHVGF
ncbi:MAG: hypothetical protein GY785_10515 [Gammaproteobacteria bacterium]|nr:hypothetical protein [Gammaproteobacteria bacterium]